MAPHRGWPPDLRARALELYRTEGMAAAHAATGVPKGTIGGWARHAGITTPGDVDAARSAGERTIAALEARAQQIADARDRRVSLLVALSEMSLTALVERMTDSSGRYDPTKAQAIKERDLVGIATRAQHDLALLLGEATENTAVAVTFTVPQAQHNPPIVINQDDLPQLGA